MGKLYDMILRHEGLKLKPYRCTEGKLTIGVGRNLDDVGLSEEEALFLYSHDLAAATRDAWKFPWIKTLFEPQQDVVVSMVFNLGICGFKEFKKMIQALEDGETDRAADEMLNSKWAAQVGKRAVELAKIMRTGAYP